MQEVSAPLTRDVKALLLQVLKRGYFSKQDIETLCDFCGIEKQRLEVEIIDKREDVIK